MKETSIAYTHSDIAKDWDFESNKNLSPTDFAKTSKLSVWWKCKNNHKYKVSIHSRIRSGGCKICNAPNKIENLRKSKLLKGKSFAQAKPELLSEWNYSKNEIKPDDISEKSHITVWFKCSNNHEWQSTPQRRSRGDGCPICYIAIRGEIVRKGKLKKSGINLEQQYPDLLKEWDWQKNTITPQELSPKSNYKVFWKCKFGHSWQSTVVNRTHAESNCPYCTSQTSKLEIFIYCECLQLFQNVKWRHKINGFECDVYLENEKIGIEIDGGYWHSNKLEKDEIKTKQLNNIGISLIRVRDSSLPDISGNVVKFDKSKEYVEIFKQTLSIISDLTNKKFDDYKEQLGNIEYQKILSYLPSPPEKDSLLYNNPDISKQWDYKLNYPLKPEMFSVGSEQKVYWICEKNHSWEATIKNRSLRNSGCPICYESQRSEIVRQGKFKKSEVSFASAFPNLLSEWDYSKNNISPFDVAPKSNLKVWWICPNSHKYEKTIIGRANGNDCPNCSSKKRSNSARNVRILKTGTLDIKYPEIASQWDFQKNNSKPSDFPPGSNMKVWWLCSNKHSWKTGISNRTKQNQGCPICFKQNQKEISLKSVIKQLGSLEEHNPSFLEEWDYEKNNDIKPSEITLNNKRKVWWLCSNHHSYSQSPNDRNSGHGCPICSKQKKIEAYKLKILENRGSFEENNPNLLKYWDYSKNKNVSPKKVTSGSREKVWWKCGKGHYWTESITSMTNPRRVKYCRMCNEKN